jgi:hypothetical protein
MKSTVCSRGIVVAIAVLIMASAANAAAITIFNTGVNASGTPLANGTIGDPHYILLTVPSGTTGLQVRTSAGGFPIPPWVGDDTVSAWIGPNNDTALDGPVGAYDYRTTFDLTGFAPGSASLAGLWAADNEGLGILINSVSTGNTLPSATSFEAFTPFSITSGFVAGVNTLDFLVNNDGGPTGLRVEISGTATAVGSATPEPASFALFGAGFAGLCMFRRRLGSAGRLR